MTQLSTSMHVSLLGHIIVIQCQPVFDLSHGCCVRRGDSTNTHLTVWIDPTGDRTQDISTLFITPQWMYFHDMSQ